MRTILLTVAATIVGLGVVGWMLEDGPQRPQAQQELVPPDQLFGPNTVVPDAPATLSPAMAETVGKATQARTEAERAAAAAAEAANAGRAGVAAAAQGQPGHGSTANAFGQISGNLVSVAMGQETPVGIVFANGAQFFGHITMTGENATLLGTVDMAGTSIAGRWVYQGASYQFAGLARLSTGLTMSVRESGDANSTTNAGIGRVVFPDGRIHDGEYLSTGEPPLPVIVRQGVGVTLQPDGSVIEAGRFEDDSLAEAL